MSDISKDKRVIRLIREAVREDLGSGDATSLALVPSKARTRAIILARSDYVVCGTTVAAAVFRLIDKSAKCRIHVSDGARVKADETIMTVEGFAGKMLSSERTALNFLQRLTGIATLTDQFVGKVRDCRVKILDTRKTTPTLRVLEKYAVKCGGGTNHRFGLFDKVLIKDNHRKLWGCDSLDKAILAARRKYPLLEIEIEVENEAELKSALKARPDWVLLDNMTPADMRKCVRIVGGRCKTEASGGINLGNVVAAARAGVDAISLGCLTHSAPAADLSMEMV